MSPTDIESRLRAGLDEHARHAPDGVDLAERIIAEAELPRNVVPLRHTRTWRTWTLPLLAAVVVAAVVGISVGVSEWQSASGDHQPAGTQGVPLPTQPDRNPKPSPHASTHPSHAHGSPSVNPVGVSGFTVSDLTFFGPDTGWAIGTATCPSGTGRCSAFVHTTDGRKWTSLPSTPFNVQGVTTGCTTRCVDHIRFATPSTGYVYGPKTLMMTTDGGQTWTPQHGGALALETLDDNVIRVVTSGSGCPGWCHVRAETAGIGSSTWTSEPLPAAPASADDAQLARTGSDAYVLLTGNTAGGAGSAHSTLYASTDDGLHWLNRGEPCPQTGPEVDGTAVAAGPTAVSVICRPRTAHPHPFLAGSANHGKGFSRTAGTIPVAADAMLSGDPATALLASGRGAYRSRNGGRDWTPIAAFGSGKVSFLGFENNTVGRAVVDGRTIFTTRNAGATWTPFTFH